MFLVLLVAPSGYLLWQTRCRFEVDRAMLAIGRCHDRWCDLPAEPPGGRSAMSSGCGFASSDDMADPIRSRWSNPFLSPGSCSGLHRAGIGSGDHRVSISPEPVGIRRSTPNEKGRLRWEAAFRSPSGSQDPVRSKGLFPGNETNQLRRPRTVHQNAWRPIPKPDEPPGEPTSSSTCADDLPLRRIPSPCRRRAFS